MIGQLVYLQWVMGGRASGADLGGLALAESSPAED
jgi:hypothetical protein